MKHLESIFKNYDVRGEYPSEVNEGEVYEIGSALVQYLNIRSIAVGRDSRPSADSLFDAFSRGVVDQGGNIVDLGLVTSPMCFFALNLDVEAAVMITASHLPSNFNGLKIYKKGHIPVNGKVLKDIEAYIKGTNFEKSDTPGSVKKEDIRPKWNKYFTDKFDFSDSNFSIVVDPANMIGILEIDTLKEFEPDFTIRSIFDEFDHTCPNHEANPAKSETLKDLSKEVLKTNANIGVAFDGDADRVGFVDENGKPVTSDIIGAIIATHIMETGQGNEVVHTLDVSKSLPELVKRKGGVSYEVPVGYPYVTQVMRENGAEFGIELSGHFFFKEMGVVEGGILPILYILTEMKRRNMKLSELAAEIAVYHHSGQINSKINLSIEEIYNRIKDKYEDGEHITIDGLKILYDDWWFSVRPSSTEPVMRLSLEADTKELMDEKVKEIVKIIRAEE